MDPRLVELLREARTVAVVGISDKPDRPSHAVAAYLIAQGYDVIPVNPLLSEVLGRRCFPDVASIGRPVDIVDVFRKSESVPEIAAEAVACKARALWLQEGVRHDAAASEAAAAGLVVVQDRCIAKVLRELAGG